MIEADGLTKKFGELVAVNNVSFTVERGEVFGLLGPNGAGKTTLIRMLSTLTAPTSGTARIGGYDIIRDDDKVRTLIGLVSEKIIMYDRLTARENLWFFGKLYDIPDDVLEERIDELLELVKLSEWKDSLVGTFSTGMRQRMNVIRALLNVPQVLFLDEPTLGLDPQSTVEIREFVRRLNRENKMTIILTTHMMVEAEMLCDRVGIIDYGKIVAADTPRRLKKMISGEQSSAVELEIANLSPIIVDAIRSLSCVSHVVHEDDTHLKVYCGGEEAFDELVDAVRKNGGRIRYARNLEPTLEDVFLKLTGHEVRDRAEEKVKATGHRFLPRSRIR